MTLLSSSTSGSTSASKCLSPCPSLYTSLALSNDAISSACLRGDSSARRRLARWLEGAEEGDSSAGGAEAAFSAVLGLHGGAK